MQLMNYSCLYTVYTSKGFLIDIDRVLNSAHFCLNLFQVLICDSPMWSGKNIFFCQCWSFNIHISKSNIRQKFDGLVSLISDRSDNVTVSSNIG
jgi:hypothetical protein